MILVIVILTSIGLACAMLIFIMNKVLPAEPEALKKTEKIAEYLPGVNCGACGLPGCFAYAQALAKDKDLITTNPCMAVLQDEKMLGDLERMLDIKIDSSSMNKKAVVCCTGDPETISNYSGIETCKSASKLTSGFKKCPYGCLGFGDCAKVCPQDAIQIYAASGRNIAVVDPEKCTGCGLCVKECPNNLIKLVPADTKIVFLCSYDSIKDIPGREKCFRGCLHCRKCYKACEHDAIIWNKEKGIPEFDSAKCTLCGACIEVCPHDKLIELSKVTPEDKKEYKEKEKVGSK